MQSSSSSLHHGFVDDRFYDWYMQYLNESLALVQSPSHTRYPSLEENLAGPSLLLRGGHMIQYHTLFTDEGMYSGTVCDDGWMDGWPDGTHAPIQQFNVHLGRTQ